MATPSKLLTVSQFAEALGVTVACVRRWVLERKIAHVKVGRLVRFRPEVLEEVISQGVRPAREVRN